MTDTCDGTNCPHGNLLEKARAACLACPRGGRPSGHGGQVSIEAAGERVVARERAYIDRSPRGQMTKLPEEQENALGELFRRWCGMDTIDALLALHTSNGGSCDTFGDYLLRVNSSIEALRPERPAMRATAWAKWQSLMRRFSPIFPRLRLLQSWTKGHGGGKVGHNTGDHHFKDPAKEARRIENKRKKLAAIAEKKWEREMRDKLKDRMPADVWRCGLLARNRWIEQQLGYAKQQRQLERMQREQYEQARLASVVPSAGTEAGVAL